MRKKGNGSEEGKSVNEVKEKGGMQRVSSFVSVCLRLGSRREREGKKQLLQIH